MFLFFFFFFYCRYYVTFRNSGIEMLSAVCICNSFCIFVLEILFIYLYLKARNNVDGYHLNSFLSFRTLHVQKHNCIYSLTLSKDIYITYVEKDENIFFKAMLILNMFRLYFYLFFK